MKRFTALLLIIITVFTALTLPAYASQLPEEDSSVIVMTIDPRLNNGSSCTQNFSITSSGYAGVRIDYSGISGVTTKVTSTVYLEKKTLWLFWTRVDIGTTDDEWVDSSTSVSGSFTHSKQLSSTGTYRAVFVVKMYGSGGATDTIEKNIEKKYS